MPFKDISFLQLWLTSLFGGAGPGNGQYEEDFCEIILNLDKWFWRCLLKLFIIYRSGLPSCLVEWKHLDKFGRGHYEDHFCETSLNLDQRFRRRCPLKIFHIFSSGSHLDFNGAVQFRQFWQRAF